MKNLSLQDLVNMKMGIFMELSTKILVGVFLNRKEVIFKNRFHWVQGNMSMIKTLKV